MNKVVQQHIDYLNDPSETLEEKVNYYRDLANHLMKQPNYLAANNYWTDVTAALAYAENLTAYDRMFISNLYVTQEKGKVSGSVVIEKFESQTNHETNVLNGFLNIYSPYEILQARKLALAFLSETEGAKLEHNIYKIAEGVYLEKGENYDGDSASRQAYMRYVELVNSPLIAEDRKATLIRYAKEVFLNE